MDETVKFFPTEEHDPEGYSIPSKRWLSLYSLRTLLVKELNDKGMYTK